jgi:hypothetical protein
VIDHDEMDADDSSMRDILAPFVPDWIEHRLTEPANLEKLVLPATLHDPLLNEQEWLMEKQLRERERQIEVLRGQLEA